MKNKDPLTKQQRSYCMSKCKSKDTGLEQRVRSELHRRGYRFRKHLSDLPGKPDIVFTKQKLAVFLDGDFWHGYRFPQWADDLSPFWKKKISETRERDKRNFSNLRKAGWTVLRIWEHEVEKDLEKVIHKIENCLE